MAGTSVAGEGAAAVYPIRGSNRLKFGFVALIPTPVLQVGRARDRTPATQRSGRVREGCLSQLDQETAGRNSR